MASEVTSDAQEYMSEVTSDITHIIFASLKRRQEPIPDANTSMLFCVSGTTIPETFRFPSGAWEPGKKVRATFTFAVEVDPRVDLSPGDWDTLVPIYSLIVFIFRASNAPI